MGMGGTGGTAGGVLISVGLSTMAPVVPESDCRSAGAVAALE